MDCPQPRAGGFNTGESMTMASWFRYMIAVPFGGLIAVLNYDVSITEAQGKAKLRELFLKNKHLTDIRAIDILVVKVRPELDYSLVLSFD